MLKNHIKTELARNKGRTYKTSDNYREVLSLPKAVAYPGIFFGAGGFRQEFFRGGGVQQIQLRTEGRENGDLGAIAPQSGVPLNLQMSEPRILIRLLRIYFPWTSEFSSASEFRGGGVWTPKPPRSTPLAERLLLYGVNNFTADYALQERQRQPCLIQNNSLNCARLWHLMLTTKENVRQTGRRIIQSQDEDRRYF
jgi:hypothetical protein